MTAARASRFAVLLVAAVCCNTPGVAASSAQPSLLTPQPTLERIAALLASDDLATAEQILVPTLASHPGDPVLHNLAGVVAARRGSMESAESHFQTAIRLAPGSAAAYENLGRLYQELSSGNAGMRGRAIETWQRLLGVQPDHVEARFQHGFLLTLDGRYAESLTSLEALPDEITRRPQVGVVLATDLAGVGNTSAAERTAAAAAADPALTEADVLAVLPAIPQGNGDALAVTLLEALDRRALASTPSLRALATVHARAGRMAEARAVLDRAVRLGGPSVPLLMDLARAAVALKDYRGALGYLAHARALEPSNANVHFVFGMVCVEQNLVREAYESLKRAVDLDPDNPLINYAMGSVATHRHEPSEAVPYFQTYVRLRPDDPRGHFALGAALFYSNQFVEARPPLQRAAAASETATGAHLFLGRIARQLNDLAGARTEIDQALALDPRLADAWSELGLIQTREEQYAEAEQSLAKALAIDPDHYTASLNLATLYAKTRDPRREAQAARVATLLEQREARAQEFLRIIKVMPGSQ